MARSHFKSLKRLQRGDTLIEVLLAIGILSIVIVGAITIMSRGLLAAQTAVEHTQVRFHINSQTEMIRFLRDGYLQDAQSAAGQEWLRMFSAGYVNTTPSSYGGACTVTSGKTPFHLQKNATDVQVTTFDPTNQPAAAASAGSGLWIEATRSASTISPAYIDFQLRACWQGSGSSAEQQTVTAVRLYDPAH